MQRFILATGLTALSLAALAGQAQAMVATTAAHQGVRADAGLPVEGQCWGTVLDRLAVPLGPAYPNFRPPTGREDWIALEGRQLMTNRSE